MKRILLIAIAAVLAISMAVMGCEPGPEPTERQVIELDFATFWPQVDFQFDGDPNLYDGNEGMGHMAWMNAITDEVEARTPDDDTGYTVEWNFGSAAPGDLWSGVTAGTYDVITSGPGYTGGIMPLWEGPEYAATLNRTNAYTMTMALQELYDTFAPLQDEMDTAGVKVMHFWSTGPGYFLWVDSDPVESLVEMGALDRPVRAANPASVLTIEALNATANKIPMSQALTEFAGGTLSGILCPTDTPKGFSLGQYLNSGTGVLNFSYQFVFMKVMNPDTWASLPTVVQEVFDDVNAVWPEYYGKLRTWGEADGLEYCYDEIPGFSMYDLETEDETEFNAWVAATEDLIDAWIGTDTTRAQLWGNFTALDAWATGEYGDWTSGDDPPDPPSTF